MIRLPVRELELLRDRVVALLQFERAHADLTDETWIARRLELRLKLQAINDQLDQERPDHWARLDDGEFLQRHEARRQKRVQAHQQRKAEKQAAATCTGPRLWTDVPQLERVDEAFLMTRWGANDLRWVQRRLRLAMTATCAAAVKWKDASRWDRWSQCTQPTAPGATFCRVHGGPLMPSKDVPPVISRVKPVVMPRRMWLHPTEPAEVIPPVPITEGQPPRDLAPHLSYTEIESRARSLVSHHYASMGRKRSRRYEGFR